MATADFTARQWEFLVGLPGRVIVAAAADRSGDPASTVAGGIAGLEAVAAGRSNDCDLVRDVVAAIYAERTASSAAATRATDLADVVAGCRRATKVLARADPADSAAYRQWIQSIAARVCAAVDPAPDPAFPAALGKALGLA